MIFTRAAFIPAVLVAVFSVLQIAIGLALDLLGPREHWEA